MASPRLWFTCRECVTSANSGIPFLHGCLRRMSSASKSDDVGETKNAQKTERSTRDGRYPAGQSEHPRPVYSRNLALENAPRKTFELVGDPRSGLADDVSYAAFGEVTTDMIWHQPSNEVYWFKYEFSGNVLKETHRDARLSDYSKNLIYMLRCKDPEHWTVERLAMKFHIRNERVLAILALKEKENHAMQSKQLMRSLPAYVFPVYLDDLKLDSEKEPIESNFGQPEQSKGATAATASASGLGKTAPEPETTKPTETSSGDSSPSTPATNPEHIHAVLPQVVQTAELLQLELLDLLRAHDFDFDTFKAQSLKDLEAAQQMHDALLSAGSSTAQSMTAYKEQVEASIEAMKPFFDFPEIQAARHAALIVRDMRAALVLTLNHQGELDTLPSVRESDLDPSTLSPELQEVHSKLTQALSRCGDDDELLKRAYMALHPSQRRSVIKLLPIVTMRLNGAGVDIMASLAGISSPRDFTPSPKSSRSPNKNEPPTLPPDQRSMAVDVFGFQPIEGKMVKEVAEKMRGLEEAAGNVEKGLSEIMSAAGLPSPTPTPRSFTSADIDNVSEHLHTYRGVLDMWEGVQYDLKNPSMGGTQAAFSQDNTVKKWKASDDIKNPVMQAALKRLLSEMDPEASDKAGMMEELVGYLNDSKLDDASQMLENFHAAYQKDKYPQKIVTESKFSKMAHFNWDILAAYIDSNIVGRIYHRGSGEKHRVRLATYPAFQGYTLDEFDKMCEGELAPGGFDESSPPSPTTSSEPMEMNNEAKGDAAAKPASKGVRGEFAEGELSRLNRLVGEREGEEMWNRFRENLLFNLGLAGEELPDSHMGKPKFNLRSDVTAGKGIVIYNIDDSGNTVGPSYVREHNGTNRALNEQELIWQRRRLRKESIPYHWDEYRSRVKQTVHEYLLP